MTAVLVDTMSIQEYIYSSNKLRENLGASHIVGHYVYEDLFEKALKEIGMQESNDYDLKSWKTSPDSQPTKACEAAYIGGGNATLFFQEPDKARKFIKSFSRLVLEYFPGLKLATAIKEDFVLGDFVEERKKLHKILINNRNRNYREVAIPKHGINRDCPKTGDAADVVYYPEIGERLLVSKSTFQKLSAEEKAQVKIQEDYGTLLGGSYIFGNELDSLGQNEGKSYIAIVHIDGNGMGKKFMDAESLGELRRLSVAVSNAATKCMEDLTRYVVARMPELSNNNGGYNFSFGKKEERHKMILPFRPIIVGGDDITFVCEGTMGVHLAEKTITYLNRAINAALIAESLLKEGEEISSCAGIAIVKTKYPFFRAYNLAEELINAAKRRAKPEKEGGKNTSCIDFYISSAGFAGDLETIKDSTQTVMIDKVGTSKGKRDDHNNLWRKELLNHVKDTDKFDTDEKLLKAFTESMSLHYGPYAIGRSGTIDIPSLDDLKSAIVCLQSWPKNKVMALRDALRGTWAERAYFLEELKARKLKLPEILNAELEKSTIPLYEIRVKPPLSGETKPEINIDTPLYDIIDLMDFYPQQLLLNHAHE